MPGDLGSLTEEGEKKENDHEKYNSHPFPELV